MICSGDSTIEPKTSRTLNPSSGDVMLSRAFFGAGRRRSSNAGLALLSRLPESIRPGNNARYELQQQRRWLGFANVWVDEATAAARSKDFRRRRKFYSRRQDRDEWEPDEAKPKPKPRAEVEEKLPYNWSRAKPKKDPLKMLNSGRILGRNRRPLIRKYGKPKRISKKARLAKLEKWKHDREMASKPKKEPQDTGVARRLREKRLDEQKAQRRMKQLKDRNLLPTTSADSSSPFMYKPDETRKVATMFGEIDVTQAKRLRDYREKMKQLASSKAVEGSGKTKQVLAAKAEKPVLLSSGSQTAKLDARPSDTVAARRLREKSDRAFPSPKALASGNDLAVLDPRDQLTVTEANVPVAVSAKTNEKPRDKKTEQQRSKAADDTVRNSSKKTKAAVSMPSQELPKVKSRAQARTEDEKLPMQNKRMLARTSLLSNMDAATRTTETEELMPEVAQMDEKHHLEAARLEIKDITSSDSPEALEQRTAPNDLFLLTGADRMELWRSEDLEAEEITEEVVRGRQMETGKSELLTDDEVDGNESLRWTYNTQEHLTDTPEGVLLAKALGTDTLMDFPRLVRAKTPPKPKRKFAKPEDDEDLSPFEFDDQSPLVEASKENALTTPAVTSPLDEIRRRNVMLRQELEEKAQKDYEVMLRTNLASPPVKRKRASKRLIVDPNDDSFKRIDDSEPVPQLEKPLSNNAKFRLIQPPLDIMRYIDSQLLGRRRLEEWRKSGYNIKLHAPLDNVPFTKSEERHKIQQSVFRNPQLFVAAAKISTSIPPAELPEIAFAGRSNAGKSKLINALTRRYGTARTSPRPGTTRSINFYVLGKELCLVDLPGYSFMYGKEEEIEQINQLAKDYITLRDELKRVCVLVNAQWGFQRTDREFVEFLETVNQKYQIILTKADKVSPRDLGRRTTQIYDMLKDKKCHVHPVLMVSARHGAGVGKLRMSLASVLHS